jgi:hypothetical protein
MDRTHLNKFIVGLAIVLAGCASPKSEPPVAASKSSSSLPERSADGYAAEALATYQVQRDGARTLMLINAAVKQAPNRSDIAYLHVALCRRIEGCGPEPMEARLRKLDPGNTIVWTRALANAQAQRDTAVEAQVLDAMARGERFDVYWTSLVSELTLARSAGAGAIRLESVLNETVGWLADVAIPSLQPISAACSRTRTADAAWVDRCRRFAQVLVKSDTLIVESLGLVIAKQVNADDPVALAKLDDRARTSQYLWRVSAEIVNAQVERDKFAAEHLKLMRKVRREQDVHAAITRWAGRSTIPPPDFRVDE